MKTVQKNSQVAPAFIAGVSIGDCAHVAGILNFLRLAESIGYKTTFVGSAVSPEDIAAWAKDNRPDVLALGYRLAPTAIGRLVQRLLKSLKERGVKPLPRMVFGGTPPVAEAAKALGVFEQAFSGIEPLSHIAAYLKGEPVPSTKIHYPATLVERITWAAPYPLLRHHFGQSSVEETTAGIEQIADSQMLDVVSIGPDQNAQENFFHPEDMDPDQESSGGVPVRTPLDFERLYAATRRGNYPIMRCYSGTKDVIRFGQMLLDTIHNAWTAIPLCWYNVLDRRGPRSICQSMTEAKEAMRWHAQKDIPVEVNESHHWSLRNAPDVVAVAAAYLAALNAKHAGVKDYIAQYMFNTPAETTASMDLGKMLAKLELIESLADDGFRVWRQVRAGLASFPTDLDMAKGQLAASTLISMNLKPHIVHVVAFCEGSHAAAPDDVIQSCKIVHGVIKNCLEGMPDMTLSQEVQTRKIQLLEETDILLKAIAKLPELVPGLWEPSKKDVTLGGPLTEPRILARAIKAGLLDAPHLVGNPHARGQIRTSMIGGACVAIDPETKGVLPEVERVGEIMDALKEEG